MIAMPFPRGYLAALTLAFGALLGSAASAEQFHALYAFQGGSDGANPQLSNLVEDKQGNLYGTTRSGGDATCQCGVIFKLTPSNAESVLYRFTGGSDGALPLAGLEKGADGNFYGTTSQGGGGGCADGCGTVFEVTPDGVETVLYRFAGGTDGSFPQTRLYADKHGNLFGTTLKDGDPACACGTVFKLAPGGAETVLHTFAGGADGAAPQSPLVADQRGNLFGSTSKGGGNSGCGFGCGTIYEVAAHDTRVRILHVLSYGDGQLPSGALVIDAGGNLYGTAAGGGNGFGTVFKVAPNGDSTTLYSFKNGFDGNGPAMGVMSDRLGNLYGTTQLGGDGHCQCGVIFSLHEDGTGFTTLNVFHTSPKHGIGGYSADNAVHVDKNGRVYGMMRVGSGKCAQNGCVYSVGNKN
jgi:uncharacterized repeat protein (TIGR03803 family)